MKYIAIINTDEPLISEREIEPKWALGLKYSLGIIKRYCKGNDANA